MPPVLLCLCLFHHISSMFLFLSAPNPCATSDGKDPCSHLCLINFNQTFSCACPHLMKLQPDKRTCKGKDTYCSSQTFLLPESKHSDRVCLCNAAIYNPCHQGARNRLFFFAGTRSTVRSAPNATSTTLTVIPYDRKSNDLSSVCATWPSSLSFAFNFI